MSDRPVALRVAAAAGLVALLAAAAALAVARLARDPGVVLLTDDDGAQWIQLDRRGTPFAYRVRNRGVTFRTAFETETKLPRAVLEFRAIAAASVSVDGVVVFREPLGAGDWRRLRRVELAPVLAPGPHVLEVRVEATRTPPLLWARCEALSLRTGPSWRASGNLRDWRPVLPARDGPRPFPLSREFPHAGAALADSLPFLLPVFALVAFWERRRSAPGRAAFGDAFLSATRVRWVLIGAWVVLALNNIGSVPASVGMDVELHMDYVRYLVTHHRVPLATQGGEMMQAPLAYLIFAPLYVWLSQFFTDATVVKLLRVVPFACGIAQVELAYRAVRVLYPRRDDLQIVGTVLGGLLPVNIVLAHAVANEPVVGVAGGATALLGLRIAARSSAPDRRTLALTGVAFGLALLSKVTAVLLAPPLLLAVAVRGSGSGRSPRRALASVTLVFGIAALLSGWYYARNALILGRPFVGTWNPGLGADWWQEPGYRMAWQYLRFGEALAHPIFSGIVGLWDGLYSTLWLDAQLSGIALKAMAPPWNYDLMLSLAWLALLPTLMIAAGVLRSACGGPALAGGAAAAGVRSGQRFAAACLASYLAALVVFNLRVPFYCVAKASYLVAATPCLAVLAAAGFDWITRSPRLRPLIAGAFACWAVAAYAAFFAI